MFKKRLIAIIVSIFALGVVFSVFMVEYGTFSFRALFVTLAVISVAFILGSRYFKDTVNLKRMSAVALAVAAFSFGALRVDFYNSFEINTSDFDGKNDFAEFEVSEVNSYYVDAHIVNSKNGVPKGELVRVYSDGFRKTLISGDCFTADVKYNFVDSASYLSDGISLTASASVESYQNGNGFIYKLRKSISDNSKELYNGFEYASSISKAVVIGDCSSLNSYIYSVYKASGLSHVLAISGLHVSLFSLSLYSFFMMLAVRNKFSCIFCSISAFAYTALVGFTAGSVRAAVVFMFLMMFRLLKINADSITSLFISLALLLFINPYSLFSVGLQLSYLCSLGIILAEPMLERIQLFFLVNSEDSSRISAIVMKSISALITPVIVTFAATIFSFPIICTKFDTISYISPLINVFAVPLFSYAIGFAFAAFIVAPIFLPLAKIIALPAGLVFDFVTNLSAKLYDAEIGNMSVHAPYMIVPIILSVIMILVLVFSTRRKVGAFVCISVLFCLSLCGCYLLNDVGIKDKYVIEYGNSTGEYVYLQSDKTNVYIDVGGYSSVTDSIYKNGVISLGKYVITEYEKYALKRFDRISGNMKIESLCLPNPTNTYEMNICLQIKELANSRNCDIVYYEEGYSERLTDELLVEVYTDNEQTMIRVKIMDKTVRFIGGNFNDNTESDVIVALKDYNLDGKHIEAYEIYASNDYFKSFPNAKEKFSRFYETLRIEMYKREGQLKIYEP